MPVITTISATDRPFASAFFTLVRFFASSPLGRPMYLP